MSNQIDIVIKAIDKASTELKKTKGSLDDLSKSEQLLAKSFGMGAAETKQFLAVAGVAAGVVGSATYAVKRAVDETQKYNLEMVDLARKMGTTTEEASRLAQVADDVRVSTSTLEIAFKNSMKNGVQPTIESLASLSDEYNALATPVERAQLAMKMFGERNGLEMQKLLELGGDAIRNMAADMDDARVVTEKAAAASKAYYAELDTLNDEITAIKYNVGNFFIPVMTDMMKSWRFTGEEIKKNKGPMTDAAIWSARIAAAKRVEADNTNASANAIWGQAYAMEAAARKAAALKSKDVTINVYTNFIESYSTNKANKDSDFLAKYGYAPNNYQGGGGSASIGKAQTNSTRVETRYNPYQDKKGPGQAEGGPVYPDTTYPVGERGVELFRPTTSGVIIPNDEIQSGGVTFNGPVTFVIPNQQTMSQWMKEMQVMQ